MYKCSYSHSYFLYVYIDILIVEVQQVLDVFISLVNLRFAVYLVFVGFLGSYLNHIDETHCANYKIVNTRRH